MIEKVPNYSQKLTELPVANTDQEIIKQLLIDIDSNTVFRYLSEQSKSLLQLSLGLIGLSVGHSVLEPLLEKAFNEILIGVNNILITLVQLEEES